MDKLHKCPICEYKKYRYTRYTEMEWGTVEQHGYCERCGYTIEQAYSHPIDGFYPPIRRGGKDYKGVYSPKNWRKRARVKRKYGIKYGNKDWMLMYI
jgi:hypothetical protein